MLKILPCLDIIKVYKIVFQQLHMFHMLYTIAQQSIMSGSCVFAYLLTAFDLIISTCGGNNDTCIKESEVVFDKQIHQ